MCTLLYLVLQYQAVLLCGKIGWCWQTLRSAKYLVLLLYSRVFVTELLRRYRTSNQESQQYLVQYCCTGGDYSNSIFNNNTAVYTQHQRLYRYFVQVPSWHFVIRIWSVKMMYSYHKGGRSPFVSCTAAAATAVCGVDNREMQKMTRAHKRRHAIAGWI